MLYLQEKPVDNSDLGATYDRFAGKHLMLEGGLMTRQDLSLCCKALNEPVADHEIDEMFEDVGCQGNTITKAQFIELFKSCIAPVAGGGAEEEEYGK